MRRTVRTIASLVLAGAAWLSTVAAAQPVLTADQAVKLALEHNSQIINAGADLLGARGSLYRAYSGMLPQVTASLSRSGSWNENKPGTQAFAGATFDTPVRTESYQTQPGLSGNWNVLNVSALTALSSARSGLRGTVLQREATRNLVALQARQQFYEVVKAVKLVEVSDNALQLARDNERRVRVLFEVGSVSRSDLLKTRVQTAQSQLDSIGAEQSLLAQRNALATFIGVGEAALGEVDTVLAVSPHEYDEAALLREAEANRPDLKAAAASLRSARSGLLSARLVRLPYVSVSGSATFNPVSSSTSTLRDPAGVEYDKGSRSESKRQLGARVALNWDLFDGLATDAGVASARAGLLRAQNAYDVLRRDLAGEVHQAALTYQQALSAQNVAASAVESATENMKLTQQKYNVGSATILDLIDAQVQLQRAQSQRVSALAGIRVAEARLDQVRGRGV
jgi:outer membrane protein TolC